MVKLKNLLLEKTVRLSTMKDASFEPGQFVQILGKKGKVKLDKKSVKYLAKWIRQNSGKHGMGWSFTEGKLTEDFKNNEWEVYVADENRREKIVKVAKSKRAAVILYNKLIKTDKYHEVGMRVIKEGKLNEEKPYETILRQLGGNRFIAMTGAKNLGTSTKKDLSFSIGRNAKKVTHVHIKLTSMDLYDVEFINMRGAKRKVIKKVKGVYGDMLPKIFKKYTGMNVRL